MDELYRTQRGTVIGVASGRKSKNDFRVLYRESGKRPRTPKHVHLIVDLYAKLTGNRELTMALRDHLLQVQEQVHPAERYPPEVQVFRPQQVTGFAPLNQFGEYDIEFLLVVSELIMIQEKTNYPAGHLNRDLWRAFGREDIFRVVSTATFRGPASVER